MRTYVNRMNPRNQESIRPWSFSILMLWIALSLTECVSAAPEKILNIQFGTDGSTPRLGEAAVGFGPGDLWNLYSRDEPGGGYKTFGTINQLKWSDSTLSAAELSIENAPGAWGNGSSDPMFGVFLYPFDGGNITVTITNLPAGMYSVYAYGHGGPPNEQNTLFEVFSGGKSFGTGRTTTNATWATGPWTEGQQYVLFRSVGVDAEGELKIVSMPDAIRQAIINGIQLVKQSDDGAANTLINVNFGIDSTPVKQGGAAFGQTPLDEWNLYSRDDQSGGYKTSGVLENLKFADGTRSSTGMLIENAPGAWGNEHPDSMFGVFLYPLGGGPDVTVTLTNLASGTYDLFCYGHGGPGDEQNTLFEVIAGNNSYGNQATTTTDRWRGTNWSRGDQYVRFEQVAVYPGAPVIIRAKPDGIGIGLINGIQILRTSAVPPLATVSILPAGGLFTNQVDVLISSPVGGEIRYTLDGSTPSTNSPIYSGRIKLVAAATVNALVFDGGFPVSEVGVASFSRVYAIDDGISVEWRLRYFGEGYLTDPRVAADADPDGDGASNRQEFAVGSDPTNPLSGFLVKISAVPRVEWHSVPGRKYQILSKRSIPDAAWVVVAEVVATEIVTRFTDEGNGDRNSYYVVELVP